MARPTNRHPAPSPSSFNRPIIFQSLHLVSGSAHSHGSGQYVLEALFGLPHESRSTLKTPAAPSPVSLNHSIFFRSLKFACANIAPYRCFSPETSLNLVRTPPSKTPTAPLNRPIYFPFPRGLVCESTHNPLDATIQPKIALQGLAARLCLARRLAPAPTALIQKDSFRYTP